MKFACDCMLGSLAKWLRILGYDTLYFNFIEDDRLREIAKSENRILLTKDRELFKLCDKAYLINGHTLCNQLREVVLKFNLKKQRISRCSVCNGELLKVNKETVKSIVPPYVFITQNIFFRCLKCKRVYWRGTHLNRIESLIERVFQGKGCD